MAESIRRPKKRARASAESQLTTPQPAVPFKLMHQTLAMAWSIIESDIDEQSTDKQTEPQHASFDVEDLKPFEEFDTIHCAVKWAADKVRKAMLSSSICSHMPSGVASGRSSTLSTA
jgi:hypothetical protein